MGQHARGRLGPAGRGDLVRLMLMVGVSEREAAASLSVAPARGCRKMGSSAGLRDFRDGSRFCGV